MPALLGFVAPPVYAPPAPPPPPPATISYSRSPSPITQAKPITGGNYPSFKPSSSPPPPPEPPPPAAAAAGGAAGGIGALSIGAAVAGAIAIILFTPEPLGTNDMLLQPPEPATEIEPASYPFRGGQECDVFYNYETLIIGANGRYAAKHIFKPGKILGARIGVLDGEVAYWFVYRQRCNGAIEEDFIGSVYQPSAAFIDNVVRYDRGADLGGNPPPTRPAVSSAPGNSLGAPSARPPSAAPFPAPKAPSPFGSPSGAPGNSPSGAPGGLPSGFPSPGPAPNPGPSPLPAPNPGPTPQPDKKYPGPAPNPEPYPSPNGDPGPSPGPGVGAPSPSPTPTTAPKPGPLPYTSPPPADPTKYPDTGFQPKIFQPNPLTPQPDFQPNPLTPNPLEPQKFQPNPKTGDPEPKAPPLIIPPPTTPAPTTTPTDDLRKQIDKYLGPLAIVTAGIAALVQPDKLKAAANAGTCQALAPGGCGASLSNNAQAAATNSANNGTALASIMAFLQAIQNLFLIPIKAGVELINTKLGPVMSGLNGISGFLSRTAEAAKLDKVLNAMNTILLLHNAAMLSRNLGSTLGDLTSQALATIGIKDGDSPIDVNEILGSQANSFMESLVGAEVWKGTKTSWNKASSIISSATNLMYTVRSMFDSTREIMEWTAENTGKIGNALKRFRVVGENAYRWLPEQVTVQNRFTRQLDRIREGTDSLDDAASSLSGVLGEVQSIQQEYADLQEQKQKFDKNISELTPKTRVENKPVTDAATAAKNASAAPTGTENVFRGEGEKLDA